MTIERQKELADNLIYKLRAIDPTCIVAGGAPRDWYFGNTATDIDIYVHCNGSPKHQSARLKALGFDCKRLGKDTDESNIIYLQNPNIMGVFDITGLEFKVQVIFLSISTFKLLDTFSLSICKSWYTPERGIGLDTDFKLTEKQRLYSGLVCSTTCRESISKRF